MQMASSVCESPGCEAHKRSSYVCVCVEGRQLNLKGEISHHLQKITLNLF
jgi:hypothetical protein